MAPLQRVVQTGHVVKQEAGAGGVRLDGQRLVLEGVEVLFDLLVAGLGLSLNGRNGPGHGNLAALRAPWRHQPLHVLGLGGLNPVAGSGLKENPRIAQRDGPVAVVGHDQPHRHYAVAQVVDVEDGLLFLGVVGLGGDGHLLLVVHLHGGKCRGRLHGRRRVVGGHGRQRQPEQQRAEIAREFLIVLDCIILDEY